MHSSDDFFTGEHTLLVSPHLDDVVLSCESFVGQQHPMEVLTVCTGRPVHAAAYGWDTLCGFPDSDRAMDARVREDNRAFAGTPHVRHHLGLLDRQYLPSERVRPAADDTRLTRWIDRWLDQAPEPGLVILPTGAGYPIPGTAPGEVPRAGRLPPRELVKRVAGPLGRRAFRMLVRAPEPEPLPGIPANLDHAWVRDTIATQLAGRHLTFGLYEEVPYLFGGPGQHNAERLAHRLGYAATPVSRDIDRDHKARRVGCYPSQLAPLIQHGQSPLDTAAGLPPTENYWLLTPRPAPAG